MFWVEEKKVCSSDVSIYHFTDRSIPVDKNDFFEMIRSGGIVSKA